MPPRMRSRSNRCCRSFSRMYGATSRAAHSWTDRSSNCCSSVRLKSITTTTARLRAKRAILSCAAADVHGCASIQIELACGARTVDGDFEVIRAAEERADFPPADVRVRRYEPRDGMGPGTNVDRLSVRHRLERAAIDIGNQVAKTIDADHLAGDGIDARLWAWHVEPLQAARWMPERSEVDARGEPRGCRCEPVAPFKRSADRVAGVAPLRQLDDSFGPVFVEDWRQHAVVRRDE